MKPIVLIADSDPDSVVWMKACLGDGYDVVTVRRGAIALRLLTGKRAHVLVVGEQLDDMPGAALLGQLHQLNEQAGNEAQLALMLSAQQHPPGEELVYYVINRSMSAQDVAAMIYSAVSRRAIAPPPLAQGGPRSAAEAVQMNRTLEVSRRLAVQRNLSGAGRVLVSAAIEFTSCDRAYCLYHDTESGALWQETDSDEDDERRAATGIAGFAARTGAAIALDRTRDDPRYDPTIDDPEGNGSERYFVQPVVGFDGQCHSVLIVIREGHREPFGDLEFWMLGALAERAGPMLQQLSLQIEADALIQEAMDDEGLFRREAVEAHTTRGHKGDVVRVSPAWVVWSYWVLVLALVAACVYVAVGKINQYSEGFAVVRMTGRTEIHARVAGNVSEVLVEAGTRVNQGDALARLDDAEQLAELARVEREFATQLRNHMRDPSDGGADANTRQLRVQREQAKVSLDQRIVRAARAGMVSDLRAQVGLRIAPGDVVMSIVDDETDVYVIALLPGYDHPQLREGMKLRLELIGYRYAYQDLVVETVSADVLSPAEAQRVVGDAIPVGGAVVKVTAKLPSRTFIADDREYYYADGMPARAEVLTRSEPIIFTLIPALKKL